MSDLEPRKRPRREVAPRHIPQLVVPVPFDEVREFVRDALRGTSLVNPVASAYSGWAFFQPRIRFSRIDDTHTRIELDVVETVRGADVLLFTQRRGEIDRFFVAIHDELDRRDRWRPQPPAGRAAIDDAD